MKARNTFEHTTDEGLTYSFTWSAPLRESSDSFSHEFGVRRFSVTEELPGLTSEDFTVRDLCVTDERTGEEIEPNEEHRHLAGVMAMIQYYAGNYKEIE